MYKDKKLLRLLAGLDEDITVCDVIEVRQKNGSTRIDIPITHTVHKRPCVNCGSTNIKKNGTLKHHAYHIPQSRRKTSRLLFHKQRFLCKTCGSSFMEQIPWLYYDSHMTVPLANCIIDDLHTIMTKQDIARMNGITVHFIDLILSDLKPPLPDHLPEVLCLDETFSEVEAKLHEKTEWIRFITNLSDGETGELLDILPFRNKRKMVKYFIDHFSLEERGKVKHLCCDGAAFYMELAESCFPNADVCLDNFHVTKYLHRGLFSVRTKQQEYLLSKSNALNDKFHREYVDLKHLSHKLLTSVFNQRSYWGEKYDAS